MALNTLASVRKSTRFERKTNFSDLKPEELTKLKDYPLCPSSGSLTRMRVKDLYEPGRDLEKLELPILDWPKDVNNCNVQCLLLEMGIFFC
jgi:Protein of unknown function (DUF3684)